VALFGEKLENNEISKKILRGSHSFKKLKKSLSKNIRCYILVIG
jgi:hypothetical protein